MSTAMTYLLCNVVGFFLDKILTDVSVSIVKKCSGMVNGVTCKVRFWSSDQHKALYTTCHIHPFTHIPYKAPTAPNAHFNLLFHLCNGKKRQNKWKHCECTCWVLGIFFFIILDFGQEFSLLFIPTHCSSERN